MHTQTRCRCSAQWAVGFDSIDMELNSLWAERERERVVGFPVTAGMRLNKFGGIKPTGNDVTLL